MLTISSMLETVTIKVGTEGSIYTVHSALLRKRSKFFANAMKPEWSGSLPIRPPIDLTDEDPAIFEIYLHWLYFSALPTKAEGQGNAELDVEFCTLSKCYVLGEKLMAIGFKNTIIVAFTEAKYEPPRLSHPCPGELPVTIIYKETPENSPARKLLVEMWAMYARAEWEHILVKMPSEFKVDLIRSLVNNRVARWEGIDVKPYMEVRTPGES